MKVQPFLAVIINSSTYVLVFLMSLLLSPVDLNANSGFSYSLATRADMGFGSAAYDLKAENSGNNVYSRLEFPLTSIYPSIQFALDYSVDGSVADWQGLAELTINLTSPQGFFLDYDWWESPGTPRILWSYTESGTSLQYFLARLKIDRFISKINANDLSVYFHGSYSFERMHWTANNLSGWQYDWNGSSYDLFSIKQTKKALTYELIIHSPSIGLLFVNRIVQNLFLNLSTDFLIPIMFDRDDHLLRNKLSTASGIGVGYECAGDLRWNFKRARSRLTLFVGLHASVRSMYIDSKQRQEWYGPDGSTPAGTVLTNIGHVITFLQSTVGITIGAGW
jgi:hypothetical protein